MGFFVGIIDGWVGLYVVGVADGRIVVGVLVGIPVGIKDGFVGMELGKNEGL